jgi:hypothetical protein
MKITIRIIITFLSVVASYFFIFWLPFSLIPGVHNIPAIPIIASLLLAVIVGFIVWKQTETVSMGLLRYIILGGIIIGSIGFILGFFGPIIFSPSANQGPLLGIFITGPIGFVIGLIGGGIYWRLKVKRIE